MVIQLGNGHFLGVSQSCAVDQYACGFFAIPIQGGKVAVKKTPLHFLFANGGEEVTDPLALQPCTRVQDSYIIA